MISEELKAMIERLKGQGEMRFLDAATKKQIEDFETKYSLSLPLKYKEWLQFSDGGECFLPAGVQFYGVAHKPLIDYDEDDKPDDNYLVIGTLSSGDPILCEKNGEEVSIYNHEAGVIEMDESYHDFFAFLNDLNNLLGIGG